MPVEAKFAGASLEGSASSQHRCVRMSTEPLLVMTYVSKYLQPIKFAKTMGEVVYATTDKLIFELRNR